MNNHLLLYCFSNAWFLSVSESINSNENGMFFWQMLAIIALVLASVFALSMLLKKKSSHLDLIQDSGIEILSSLDLDKNQKLMVAKFNEQEVLLAYSKSGIVALAKKEKEIKAPVIKPLSVVPGPQDTQFSRTSFNQLFKDTESMRESSRDTDGILKLKEVKKMRQS